MGDGTGIQWTDATWNPVRGCSRVSPGCAHCYAETIAARFSGPGQPYEGLAERVNGHARWTGTVLPLYGKLDEPRRWKRSRRIFVNSMADLFHEQVPDTFILNVFRTMLDCPRHTFQILTKRPERMRAFVQGYYPDLAHWHPHVWLGVSVESAPWLDRIDILRAIPAAVRFVSFEPLLGEIGPVDLSGIHWAILGGESGPGARPCDLRWIRQLRSTCIEQGTACFIKQLGACTIDGVGERMRWHDAHGGDPDEWPQLYRLRQFPPSAGSVALSANRATSSSIRSSAPAAAAVSG